MTTGVTVKGATELSATLNRAAGDLADMERAGDRAITLVANRARVDAPRRSGALASSVAVEVDKGVASAFSPLPYAARTNYGYSRYNQRAQPFLTNAIVQLEGPIVGEYQDEADRILHTVRGA